MRYIAFFFLSGLLGRKVGSWNIEDEKQSGTVMLIYWGYREGWEAG